MLRKISPFEFENWAVIALDGIDRFFRKTGKVIVALTVREILEEELAKKLA